jgi:hypothetical protein
METTVKTEKKGMRKRVVSMYEVKKMKKIIHKKRYWHEYSYLYKKYFIYN